MTPRFTPTLAICAIGAAVAGGLLALPPADDAAPAPPAVAAAPAGGGSVPAPAAIQIADFSFAGSRTATAGAVVQVTNADAAAHTLTATSGAFDTGVVEQGRHRLVHRPGRTGHVRVHLRDPPIDDRLAGRRLNPSRNHFHETALAPARPRWARRRRRRLRPRRRRCPGRRRPSPRPQRRPPPRRPRPPPPRPAAPAAVAAKVGERDARPDARRHRRAHAVRLHQRRRRHLHLLQHVRRGVAAGDRRRGVDGRAGPRHRHLLDDAARRRHPAARRRQVPAVRLRRRRRTRRPHRPGLRRRVVRRRSRRHAADRRGRCRAEVRRRPTRPHPPRPHPPRRPRTAAAGAGADRADRASATCSSTRTG